MFVRCNNRCEAPISSQLRREKRNTRWYCKLYAWQKKKKMVGEEISPSPSSAPPHPSPAPPSALAPDWISLLTKPHLLTLLEYSPPRLPSFCSCPQKTRLLRMLSLSAELPSEKPWPPLPGEVGFQCYPGFKWSLGLQIRRKIKGLLPPFFSPTVSGSHSRKDSIWIVLSPRKQERPSHGLLELIRSTSSSHNQYFIKKLMPVKWVFDTKLPGCDFGGGVKNINLFNNSSFIPLALLNIKQVKVKYLKTKCSWGAPGRADGWAAAGSLHAVGILQDVGARPCGLLWVRIWLGGQCRFTSFILT